MGYKVFQNFVCFYFVNVNVYIFRHALGYCCVLHMFCRRKRSYIFIYLFLLLLLCNCCCYCCCTIAVFVIYMYLLYLRLLIYNSFFVKSYNLRLVILWTRLADSTTNTIVMAALYRALVFLYSINLGGIIGLDLVTEIYLSKL